MSLVEIDKSIVHQEVCVFIRRDESKPVTYLSEIRLRDMAVGTAVALYIPYESVQAVMDALWSAGYKPSTLKGAQT